MSVHVHLPIRIRLEARDLAELDAIGDATAAAATRALARSRAAVLEPRGAYVRPVLEAPRFTWTGDAGAVPEGIREALEERIAAAIDEAVDRAGVAALAPPDEVPEPIPDDPFERMDRARWDRRRRSYEIPTYGEKKPKTTKAPVTSADPAAPPPMRKATRFVRVSAPNSYQAVKDTLARHGVDPERFATLRENDAGTTLLELWRRNGPGEWTVTVTFTARGHSMTDLNDKPPLATIAPFHRYTFEHEHDGDVVGHEAFRASLRQSYLNKHGIVGHQPTADEIRKLEEDAKAYVAKLTDGYEDRVGCYYVLRNTKGEVDYRVPVRKEVTEQTMVDRSWTVYNITEVREVPAGEDGAADAAGGGLEEEPSTGMGLADYAVYEGGMPGGTGVVLFHGGYTAGAGMFPTLPGSATKTAKFERYWGEPPIDQLGAAGEKMRVLIEMIAGMLRIPTFEYAAGFAIEAAKIIGIRAEEVTDVAMDERAETVMLHGGSIGARDAKGNFYFEAVPSVAVQFLRHLGRVIPLLRQLINLVLEHIAKLPGAYFAWGSHFFRKVADPATSSVKRLYLFANQIVMLQLLNATRDNVKKRRDDLDRYVQVFGVLCETLLADQTELVLLRQALERFLRHGGFFKSDRAYERARSGEKTDAMLALDKKRLELVESLPDDKTLMIHLVDREGFVLGRQAAGTTGAGEIFLRGDKWVIRDSEGDDWSKEELDASVSMRRDYAESIDPLVTKIVSFPDEIRPVIGDHAKTRDLVVRILDAMDAKNDEIQRKVRSEHSWAFEHGIFREDLKNPTVARTRYNLQGVHLMAHQAIGDVFEDDWFYSSAIQSLIASELGGRALLDDLCFVGTIVLSVLCPPLGMAFGLVTGLAMGIADHRHAKELEAIHEALLDPEKVLSRAEIEVRLFCAKLAIGLSFLSLVPAVGKGAGKAFGALAGRAVREGLEEGVKVAAKRGALRIAVDAVMRELKAMVQMIKSNLAGALALEVAEEKLEDVVFGKLMEKAVEARIAQLKAAAHAGGID